MASEREIARQRALQAKTSQRLQERAKVSPGGDNAGSRRSATSVAPAPRAAKPAATPSTFGKGATGLSASPGGLNVSPEELAAIQAAVNPGSAPMGATVPGATPAAPAAGPKTIYIPGVGSVTVGQ